MGGFRGRVWSEQPLRQSLAGCLFRRAGRSLRETELLHQVKRLALITVLIWPKPIVQSFGDGLAREQFTAI